MLHDQPNETADHSSGSTGVNTKPTSIRSRHVPFFSASHPRALKISVRSLGMPSRERLSVIPIAPDGQPDLNYQIEGRCLDLSVGGIGLELAGRDDVPTGNLLICSRWGGRGASIL